MIKRTLIFLPLIGFLAFQTNAQQILFEENFDNWDTVNVCPVGWDCGTSGNCLNRDFCNWNRNDLFIEIGTPDSAGCDGSDFYARCNAVKLQIGQIPFMTTPVIELSNINQSDNLGFQFCYINQNSLPIDEDGIRVSYSADSGQTWQVQFFDNSRNFRQWAVITLPIPTEFRTDGFQVRLEGIAGNSTGDIGIDGITLTNFSGDCKAQPFSIDSNNRLEICKDGEPDTLAFTNDQPDTTGANVRYVIANQQDTLITVINGNAFNFDLLPQGLYRVYGIAYVGVLQPDSAILVTDITASVCVELSQQFLSVAVGTLNINTQITSAFDSSVSCNGARDGQISVIVSEGTSPFTYSWNTGQNQAVISNQGAGTYQVTVSDANQCRERDTVVITEPPLLIADATITSDYNGADISCSGEEDGSVYVVASGGTPPYSFLWSNGATSDSLTQLGAREYIVFVRDQNGCVSLDSATLISPQPFSVTAEVVSDYGGNDISAPGAEDGEALATATGGTPPYNFAWNTNPPQLSRRATSLRAGTYSVTAVDQNGCIASTNVVVRNPGELGATAVVISDYNGTPISCPGANDGSITAIVSGGVPPFTYEWSTTPIRTSDTLNNLGPGTYTVIITDGVETEASATVTLEEPETVNVIAETQNPACEDDSSGVITLNATGGTLPYSYRWEDSTTGPILSALPPGIYSYEVQDANNCHVIDSATINEGKGVNASFTISNETCPGFEDGAIITTLNTGTPPFTYLWSSGDTSQDILGIGAGTYWVRIEDSLGCQFSDTLTVNSLDSLKLIYSTTPDNGNETGSATVTVSGGLPPYSYQWSTSVADTGTSVGGLATGLYLITVSDAAGCQISQQIDILPQETQCPPVHAGISPNGDGINDEWFIPCLSRLGSTVIYIYNRWGQKLLSLNNYDNNWNGEVDGKALPPGTYFYLLKSSVSGQSRTFKGTITIVR